jgi:hypothetical protein
MTKILGDLEITEPDISRKQKLTIDATPEGYAMRLLEVYLEDARSYRISSNSSLDTGKETNPLCIEMNRLQDERVVELERAIRILKGNGYYDKIS